MAGRGTDRPFGVSPPRAFPRGPAAVAASFREKTGQLYNRLAITWPSDNRAGAPVGEVYVMACGS
jgi:hypothetical protein